MLWRIALKVALALICALPAVVAAGPGKRGEPAKAKFTQVVYPVADLVVPIDGVDTGEKPGQTLEGRLLDLVKATVAPASWKENGGPGHVQYYPLGMALVVNQTRDVQEEVADLLAALRRLQDIEVCVEMRIVSMHPDAAKRFKESLSKAQWERLWGTPGGGADKVTQVEHTADKNQGSCKSGNNLNPARPVYLTNEQILALFKDARDHPATNTMQAPKITMFNGQLANMTVATHQSYVTQYKVVRENGQVVVVPNCENVELGVRCAFLPIVSADRRTVQLKMDYRQTSLVGAVPVMPVLIKVSHEGGEEKEFRGLVQQPQVQTLSFKQSCTIPDGQTMAVSLGKIDVETSVETLVLSRIPYVGRLMANVGTVREAREVFLFVTPRIIVNEETEQPFQGVVPPIPVP